MVQCASIFLRFPRVQALEEHRQKNHASVPVLAHRDDFLQSSSPGSTGGAYKLCTIRALGCELIPAKGCEKRRVCLCCSRWLNICCCIELANPPLNKAHNVRHITVLGFVLVQHTKGHDDRRLAQLLRIAAVNWCLDYLTKRVQELKMCTQHSPNKNGKICSNVLQLDFGWRKRHVFKLSRRLGGG